MLHTLRASDKGQVVGFSRENSAQYVEYVSQEARRLLAKFTQFSAKTPCEQALPSNTVNHGHTMFQSECVNDAGRTPRSAPVSIEASTENPPPKQINPHNHSSSNPALEENERANPQECLTVLNPDRKLEEEPPLSDLPVNPVPQTDSEDEDEPPPETLITQPPSKKRGWTLQGMPSPEPASKTQRPTSTAASRETQKERGWITVGSPSPEPERSIQPLRISSPSRRSIIIPYPPNQAIDLDMSPLESRSLLKSPDGLAPRRSGRAKNKPVTYNVRVLSGLESNETRSSSRQSLSRTSRVSSRVPSEAAPELSLSADPPSVSILPKNDTPRRTHNVQELLWDRELLGRSQSTRILTAMTSDLRPWKSWKGASSDVTVLAWSPDSTKFAAGAAAQPEYNRRYNLLLGDLVNSALYELPDHWTPSSSATDERLYTSVTDMQWVGDRLYTASYDNTVKIWDAAHKHPSCLQTLEHSSKVVVMALSKPMPNLIATGTDKFQLWDVQEDQAPTCVDLSIVRHPRQKNIDLVPTTLAWGHTASTNHVLVGGMVERILDEYKVPNHGHLGLWTIGQGSVTPHKLVPDSQNVFDIKWHPFLPKFVAATTYSQAMQLPLKTRTVLQLYDCIDGHFTFSGRFPCPAADVMETSFCPMDSTYITASCTDGRTYVWDVRFPDKKSILQLPHGAPLHPLNHKQPRELTDYGVSFALWGTSMDQFYTGGSDGLVKQWDIRRAPEDALVANIASFDEGITSGAFSEDGSHLLIGSHGGGIRVLSTGPCSDPEKRGFEFRRAPEPPSQDISGREASSVLLSNAEIEMHPIYGPGQGSNYQGPYARWARDATEDTPLRQLKRIPLKDEYQIRQLWEPEVQPQGGLDHNEEDELKNRRHLARIRNSQPDPLPRDKPKRNGTKVELSTENRKKKKRHNNEKDKKKRKKRRHGPVVGNIEVVYIDLTGDSPEPESTTLLQQKRESRAPFSLEHMEDGLEDDYWWPDSGRYDANICDSD